jgi:serine/threonine protein kinase
MNEPNQSLEEFLFETALTKHPAEERVAFLEGVCRDNPALRARLEVLLEGHFQAEGFLADGTKEIEQKAAPPRPEGEAVSTVIGRYKLLERIGEGGFGEVWMAEQKEPVKRRVALKIIKLGMDTRQVVARFEAERQALALMEHRVISSGNGSS